MTAVQVWIKFSYQHVTPVEVFYLARKPGSYEDRKQRFSVKIQDGITWPSKTGVGVPTFFLGHIANITCDAFQRVDENVQVRAVDLTSQEELQIMKAVLGFPPRPALHVEKFGLKCLNGEKFGQNVCFSILML